MIESGETHAVGMERERACHMEDEVYRLTEVNGIVTGEEKTTCATNSVNTCIRLRGIHRTWQLTHQTKYACRIGAVTSTCECQ
jgi:hypothetical protein